MSPGTQVTAALGFGPLAKGVRYHVVYVDRFVQMRVVLAHFDKQPRAAHLTYLSLGDYSRGASSGLLRILAGSDGVRLPPWLEDREQEVFDDESNLLKLPRKPTAGQSNTPTKPDISDRGVMEGRERNVILAAYEAKRIFESSDPLRQVRRLANQRGLNGQRYVRDVITYLAFDQNPDVLRPPKSGRGAYPREALAEKAKKTGRPHRHGPHHGSPVTKTMKQQMLEGWKKYARKKQQLTTVWAKTLVHVFGCTYEDHKTRTKIIHPQGKAFPTYGQFRYWMVELLSHEKVWTTLLGEQEYRRRFPVPQGSFHQGARDLLEKVYSDATSFEELPRSPFSSAATLPLIELPEYDALSGMTIGVAWGVGSESQSLYMQARAVTALPKSLIGEVLGMTIRDEEFPVAGILPRAEQTDRGAGAARKIKQINAAQGTSYDMTPSYTPQSNGSVEQSHPRSVIVSGAPMHKVSHLTAIGMAKQAMLRIMAENRSRDISNRLTPEMRALGISNSLELWNYLKSQGRITGKAVKPEEVILEYLPKVTFKIVQGRLTRNGVIYNSSDFSQTDVGRNIWRHESKELSGRAFDISNRVEWVIVGKRLIKVNAIPAMQEHEDHYLLSAHEADAHLTALLDAKSTSKELKSAERVRLEIDARNATGHGYGAAHDRKGRATSRTRRASAASPPL